MSSPNRPTHRTEVDHNETGWPKGVPYIIGNEGCERFSYYGMRAILTLYLSFLFQETGLAAGVADSRATEVFHYFVAAAYFFPILGAIIADRLLGKYQTILYLSMVYTFGHLVLSLGEGNVPMTYAGLVLIAIGAGGIKPCVSAHVGDQFGRGNWHRLTSMYHAFYFIINLGSFASNFSIPLIRAYFGWSVAFAVPGILMAIATFFFWLGRTKFVHVPPSPGGKLGLFDTSISLCLFVALGGPLFLDVLGTQIIGVSIVIALFILPFVYRARQRIEQDTGFFAVLFTSIKAQFTAESKTAQQEGYGTDLPRFYAAAEKKLGKDAVEAHISIWRIMSIFIFVCMFWALFDQHGSTWVLQARMMNLDFGFASAEPDQIQVLNPAIVMILIPITLGIMKWIKSLGYNVTPLSRMTLGMLITGLSFVSAALVQRAIEDHGEQQVHVAWQLIQYFLLTQGEVLISITGLEFAYTQAPKQVKSTVLGLWLLTTTIGNIIVSKTTHFSEGLELEAFFWTFAIAMGVFGVLFAIRAYFYKPREYMQ